MAEEKQWTKAQLDAITSRHESLLISAAAGSGKTATLTERVIRRILDDEDPVDVTDFLIVTFTKAAAGELSARIAGALQSQIAQHPENKRLQRQLAALPLAKICTISSFCLEIVQANTQALSIPSTFHILDDAEHKLLQQRIMERLLDDLFNGTEEFTLQGWSFSAFADLFGSIRNPKKLGSELLRIFRSVQNLPQRHAVLQEESCALALVTAGTFLSTGFGTYLCDVCTEELIVYIDLYRELCDALAAEAAYQKAYLPTALDELQRMKAVLAALQKKDYASLLDALAMPICRLGRVAAGKALPVGDTFKMIREKQSALIKRMRDRYFAPSCEQLQQQLLITSQVLAGLHAVLALFEERLLREKYQRQTYGFSDIEQFALQALYDAASQKPTLYAGTLAKQFREIYIDEYQDVSPLQEKIFLSFASEDNRFMVGDVKQSIYAFRGATPELFLNQRNRFCIPSNHGRTIFLSQNFRSDAHLLQFANTVFQTLFPAISKDLHYMPSSDALLPRTFPAQQKFVQTAPELILFTKRDDADDEQRDEAAYVAARIANLIQTGTLDDGRKICARDIAILLRSDKSVSGVYEQELEQYGIRCCNQAAGDFFENSEILLLLSLLHTINNPYEDIHLCALLKSPLFDISLDELICIRKYAPDLPFLTALEQFTKETGFAKGEYFLEKLAQYRARSVSMPADELIWYLFSDTGFLSIVYAREEFENGLAAKPEQMRANLLLFYEYARRFEKNSFRGLGSFIRYIADLMEEKQQIAKAELTSENADAVRIMSVHQAKGLEFPICFLCGLGKQFNDEDSKRSLVYHRTLGFGFQLRDPSGFFYYSTPIREAVRLAARRAARAEEARILYVALTRPREQLYMTATLHAPQNLLADSVNLPLALQQQMLREETTHIGWILRTPQIMQNIQLPLCDPVPVQILTESKKQQHVWQTAAYYYQEVERRLSFRYPYWEATKIPAKLSASELYPGILDQTDTASSIFRNAVDLANEDTTLPAPAFIAEQTQEVARKSGTATHVFLQFCDFYALQKGGYRAEKERLIRSGFITQQDAERIREDWIEGFQKSELLCRILASAHVYREKRFHVLLDAQTLTAAPLQSALTESEVLVQGVVDCFFEKPDGTYAVVDYKTDRIHIGEDTQAYTRRLSRQYATQLSYYHLACEKMTGKKVSEVMLYSFALQKTILLQEESS